MRAYDTGRCSLGAVVVGWTDQGLGWASLGDDPEALVAELHEAWPDAVPTTGGVFLEAVVRGVDEGRSVEVPLDLEGTAFQRRVWHALTEVPAGETVTYAGLARQLGSVARAVGQACGQNRVAVAVPCHRAVRADGGLAGFRWGLERKRALLARERGELGLFGSF